MEFDDASSAEYGRINNENIKVINIPKYPKGNPDIVVMKHQVKMEAPLSRIFLKY